MDNKKQATLEEITIAASMTRTITEPSDVPLWIGIMILVIVVSAVLTFR